MPEVAADEPLAQADATVRTTTVMTSLVTNVYTYTQPALSLRPASDTALLRWTDVDITKSVVQSHEIVASQWNGSIWQLPTSITDDILQDGSSQVRWLADGRAVAVWQRLDTVLPLTATLEAAWLKQVELVTAVSSPTTAPWSEPVRVTTNTALDLPPVLASNRAGQVVMAWWQNDAGLLSGDSQQPSRLQTSFYDPTTGWQTPVTAVPSVAEESALAVACGDGRAVLAFTNAVTSAAVLIPTLQIFTSMAARGVHLSSRPAAQTTAPKSR